MPQISLYVDDQTMESLRLSAAQNNTSLSKYAAAAIADRVASSESRFSSVWFDEVYGSIPDFPSLEELRAGIDESLDDACDWFADELPT